MNGYKIQSISWWEWCQHGKKCKYGLGGPKSNYYEGWFAELPIEVDDIYTAADISNENLIGEITNRIKSKIIPYPKETVTFKHSNWLTPAIWLNVPGYWRNNH
jgi:hypothetical protein